MASASKNLGQAISEYGKSIPDALRYATADFLANSDFISRTIGMNNSYEDIMFIVQSLGREPISLLGKDYLFIFDHVRRNYNQGVLVENQNYGLPKFTFYKERPTVRFANPHDDPMNYVGDWKPDVKFSDTSQRNILFSYAESTDESVDNKTIGTSYDIENANPGVNLGGISSFANTMTTPDILRKTNDNFNHGKYRTLIARFHTDSQDSKSRDNITQNAITEQYGMSHGRNLLKKKKTIENGYDNPYCRVWTYHHQYNQLARAIRPFGEEADTADKLEQNELSGNYTTVGFRVPENAAYKFRSGSQRLDDYGVLNYRNGLVNIAPTAKIKDYFEHKEDKQVTIKKCMFSIENLAWKSSNIKQDEYDENGLSAEQKGPLGGRIMWFPPYDLSFNEDVRVNWNQNQFIGRGEKIYTYTDTERSGTLSFTLLIDHPSILDYWTGHKRNGMKNGGKSLLPGNGGGVDEIYNQENTLLRFFAGCEILTAKPHEYKHRDITPPQTKDPEPEPKPVVTKPQEPEVVKKTSNHKIHCVLYYPNNYSGRDDYPVGSNTDVNAVYYLMNGIGTQTYYDQNSRTVKDIPTTMSDIVMVNGTQYGGYETRANAGISITDKNIGQDRTPIPKALFDKTYIDDAKIPIKSQYLTDPSGNKYTAKYGNNTYELTKMVGNGAYAKRGSGTASYQYTWMYKRFYYRVNTVPYDNTTVDRNRDYATQVFNHVDSYVDTRSYMLNSNTLESGASDKGFQLVYNYEQLCERLGISKKDDEESNDMLVSFVDLFVAAEGGASETTLSGLYDEDLVGLIRAICQDTNGEKYKITSAKILGLASKQGDPKWNEELGKNRALTFKKWLDGTNFLSGINVESSGGTYDKVRRIDVGGDNLLESKVWRCACLEINYEQYDIENAAVAEDVVVPAKDTGTTLAKVDRVATTTKETSQKPFMTIRELLHGTPEGRKALEEHGQPKISLSPEGKLVVIPAELNEWTATIQDVSKYTGKNYLDPLSWDYDDSWERKGITVSEPKVAERYDNEGEFFELLEKNDPFMHHLITDKIKYFDPAYHSISPEGFNARLTFLHQCTRQGSTVGAGEGSFSTAYNLSFGRPPVCVLRLGDFYYTKIIINSLSIQYEEPQWDLNPEGIGVMPMFAKVTLGFTFLGGSDLAGPISRLQNAVSFNYYANTSVYDNRAEMVQYDSNGSGKEVKFKPFSYPDMLRDSSKKVIENISVCDTEEK